MPNPNKNTHSRGFTLVELVVVICVLSILATIALLVYKQANVSQYDEEAIATLNDLYMQSNELITTWGIGTNTSYEIPVGCLSINPATGGSENGASEMSDQVANWKKLGLIVPGIHHWSYRVCFGHFTNDSDAPEGFLVTAHRMVGNTQRVIVYGSGLAEPIINASSIPAYATLTDAGTISLQVSISSN